MMHVSASVSQANFTAVVHAADGVRFVAKADCPERLASQIVDYILARCDEVLWPSAAKQVRALIGDRQLYAAIALYFAQVGERWDEERLELGGLSLGASGPSRDALAQTA
jgi:hypothetical protein